MPDAGTKVRVQKPWNLWFKRWSWSTIFSLKKKKKKKKRETGDDVWMLHTFSKSAHPQGPYMVQR